MASNVVKEKTLVDMPIKVNDAASNRRRTRITTRQWDSRLMEAIYIIAIITLNLTKINPEPRIYSSTFEVRTI